MASLSKPIAATVVGELVTDGVLTWNSRITDLDPSFQLYDAYPTNQLTVTDLFNHRSGLPGDAGNDLASIGFSRDEIMRRLRYMPPASSFRAWLLGTAITGSQRAPSRQPSQRANRGKIFPGPSSHPSWYDAYHLEL